MDLSIILVYDHRCDSEMLQKICSDLGMKFTERYFDSENIYIDRDFIEALPSIHILDGKDHLDTICIHDDIEHRIDVCVEKYRIKKAKKTMGSFSKLFQFLARMKP